MDHSAHEPGTRDDCEECRALSYEPGWYRSMRDERVTGRLTPSVLVPEAESEDAAIDLEVPDLEPTTTDDERR